jgi:hypothetical protein
VEAARAKEGVGATLFVPQRGWGRGSKSTVRPAGEAVF